MVAHSFVVIPDDRDGGAWPSHRYRRVRWLCLAPLSLQTGVMVVSSLAASSLQASVMVVPGGLIVTGRRVGGTWLSHRYKWA